MAAFSKNLEYESAQITKEKIALVKNYQSKSTIVSHTITDVDVFTIASNQTSAFVNFLKILINIYNNQNVQEKNFFISCCS